MEEDDPASARAIGHKKTGQPIDVVLKAPDTLLQRHSNGLHYASSRFETAALNEVVRMGNIFP